ncbi:Hypothetical protein, putative [Bodo saltans]|uniref:Uncharacterized protein n=1 Tax=Bodo saltans TaxID=75058 RepID=A0A0S4ISI5_BODSA|nr:Hypothetical protein, putative [Bodo saltans]|eukprot:CUF67950.1 Hypothetical protein, putative [Bodo saltans]
MKAAADGTPYKAERVCVEMWWVRVSSVDSAALHPESANYQRNKTHSIPNKCRK